MPQLYAHVLGHLFSFLTLQDLASAACVSRLWLHTMETMPAIAGETPSTFQLTLAIARSKLARHVADCKLTLSDSTAGPLLASLINLRRVQLNFPSSDSLHVNSCITTLGSRCVHLTYVQLRVPSIEAAMSFVALQQLAHLSTLLIFWGSPQGDDDGQMSDAQIDSIRAMPRLEQVMIGTSSAGLLRRLLRQPHNLQWKQLNPRFINVDEERAAAIALLPSQHTLRAHNCCTLTFLSSLTNLRDLTLESHINPRMSSIFMPLSSDLSAAIRPLTQLTSLQLQSYRLYFSDLRALFGTMPALKQLVLLSVRELGDAECFLAAPASMQTLVLVDVRLPPSVQVQTALTSLQSLTELMIQQSFAVDAATVAALTPPSSLIPALKRFKYVAPD